MGDATGFCFRFWKATELRTEAAEKALRDVATLDCQPDQQVAVELAQTAAAALSTPDKRLEALRLGLETLSRGTPLGPAGLAALAQSLGALDSTHLTWTLAQRVPSAPLQTLLKAGARSWSALQWTATHPDPDLASFARIGLDSATDLTIVMQGLTPWRSRHDVAERMASLADQPPEQKALCRATLESLAQDQPLDPCVPAWVSSALSSLQQQQAAALWALEQESRRLPEHAPYFAYLHDLVKAGGDAAACLELASRPEPLTAPQLAQAALKAGPPAFSLAVERLKETEEGARVDSIAPKLTDTAARTLQRQCLEHLAAETPALAELDWARAALPKMDEPSSRVLARWTLERAQPRNEREAAWKEFHERYPDLAALAPKTLVHVTDEPDFGLRISLLAASEVGPGNAEALGRECPPPGQKAAWAIVASCAAEVAGPALQAGLSNLAGGPNAVARAMLTASPEAARPLLGALPPDSRRDFLRQVADHTPLLEPDARPRCLSRALEYLLAHPSANLADVGLRAARAAGNLQDKLHLAELTLEAMSAQQAGSMRRAVMALRQVVREPMPGLANGLWYRTATAMAALHCVAGEVPVAPLRALTSLSRELRETAWAPAPWLVRVCQRGLESAGFPAPETPLTWEAADRMQGLLDEVSGGAAALFQDGPSGTITREEESVIVGCVRVPRRGAAPVPVARPGLELVASMSKPNVVNVNYALEGVLLDEGTALAPIEVRTSLGYPACYSPADGTIHTSERSTTAVAYNPRTGLVETESQYRGGAAGVYDPGEKKIVWKSAFKCGVAGYYDPVTRKPHFETAHNNGVGLAYDLDRGWQKETRYKNGVAGAWDPVAGKLRWDYHYHWSASAASNDPECPTLSGPSFHHQEDRRRHRH
ncbi:MAG: hypothetical protein HY319_03060 [Armatimonadetes bacterium]|nr:hypothetical protein [Armatimonadota bacterium]